MIGAITWVRGILLFVTQIIGGIAAAALTEGLFPGALAVDTTLATTVSVAQGVLIEMLLTTLLVFTIFMLAAEKHTGNFIAPVGIGLALFISELVGMLAPTPKLAPYQPDGLTLSNSRCFLDRWLPQSCSLLWPTRCNT